MTASFLALLLVSSLLGACPASADSSADRHYSKGLKLYVSGQYDAAADELKQALAADAKHAQAKELLQLISELRKEQGSGKGVVSQLTSALQAQEEESRRLKSVLSSAEQRITELAESTQSLQGELEARGKEQNALQEKIAALAQQLEQRDQQLKQREDARAALEQANVRLQAEHQELERQFADAQESRRNETATLQRELTQAQQDRTLLSGRVTALESSNEQLKAEAQETRRLNEELAKSDRRLKDAGAEQDSLRAALADARKQLDDAMAERTSVQQQYKELSLAKQQLADQLEQAAQRRANTEGQLGATSAKLKASEQRFEALQQETQAALLRGRDTEHQLNEELVKARRAADDLATAKTEIGRLTDTLTAEREAANSVQQQLAAALQTNTEAEAKIKGLQQKQEELLQAVAQRTEDAQALQIQLAAAKQQAADTIGEFGGNLNRMLETKEGLEKQLKERDAALTDARAQLQQAFGTQEAVSLRAEQLAADVARKEKELAEATKTLAGVRAELTGAQQEVQVSKHSQVGISAQFEDLQAKTADYDQMKTQLLERESQVRQLQGQVERLTREAGDVKATLSQVQADLHEHQQQVLGERQGYKWRLEQVQRELDAERMAKSDLKQKLENELNAKAEVTTQLSGQLVDRENRLKQAESVIRILESQGQGAAGATPPSVESAPESAPASPPAKSTAQRPVTSTERGSPVKVYQVNDELGFVVLSIKDVDWAQKGMTCLLAAQNDEPVATVELTELDSEGFAVAQITHRMDPMKAVRKGDLLFVRQLLRPAPD